MVPNGPSCHTKNTSLSTVICWNKCSCTRVERGKCDKQGRAMQHTHGGDVQCVRIAVAAQQMTALAPEAGLGPQQCGWLPPNAWQAQQGMEPGSANGKATACHSTRTAPLLEAVQLHCLLLYKLCLLLHCSSVAPQPIQAMTQLSLLRLQLRMSTSNNHKESVPWRWWCCRLAARVPLLLLHQCHQHRQRHLVTGPACQRCGMPACPRNDFDC